MDMGEVTRQELDARLDLVKAWIDARFAESDAKTEARFAAADAKTDARFAAADAKADAHFAAADAKADTRYASADAKADARYADMEVRFAKLEATLQKGLADMLRWMVGTAIAIAAVGVTVLLLLQNYSAVPKTPAPIVIYLPAPSLPVQPR